MSVSGVDGSGDIEGSNSTHLMPGDELHGFILEAVDVLDDYHGFGYLFRHRITGMEVYHVANDDSENFFAYLFKTPPLNDCGTPHIIEHSILAGSKKYPLRDPFMTLLKGSANTFMNAMTYPDYTAYPAASPLEKDFSHLFSVYTDAVFDPLLREETFWQEGIRITADKDGNLQFDGVVYNEMLGELSDHDSIVGRDSVRSLYPDTPYFFESGGEPEEIVKLNYRQFVSYYGSYYHPSNCRLFIYGNLPVTDKLAMLDDEYLSDYSALSPAGPSPLAKTWSKPKSVVTTSPCEEGTENTQDATVTISWATTLAEDPLEVLTLSVLTDILLGNPGAPLYKAIIDSQLSKDISQVSGMDTSFRQMPFTVGFKGIDPAKASLALALVLETLQKIVDKGIPSSLVENAVKRQEFSMQELTGDSPIGLRAMNRAARGWLQNLSPHTTIRVRQPLEVMKRRIIEENPLQGELFTKEDRKRSTRGYFEQWIQEHLIDNPHRCLLTVKPDSEHGKKQEQVIERRLQEVLASLEKHGLAKLQEETLRFNRFEEQKDSPEIIQCIPTLVREDLPKVIRTLPQELTVAHEVPLYVQLMETNGIIYTDALLEIDDLADEEQLLLPVFTRLLHMTGVGDVPYDQVAVRIRNITGGLFFYLENSSMLMTNSASISALVLRMKCLERDHAKAMELVSDILRNARVDDIERIGAVINDLVSDFEGNITSSGQMYASQRAAAGFSPILKQNETWNGISQWFHLKGYQTGEVDLIPKLAQQLTALQRKLAIRSRMILHVCAPESVMMECRRRIEGFVESFPHEDLGTVYSRIHVESTPTEHVQSIELFRIPAAVSFSALAFRASEPFHPQQAHQTVLTHILTTNQLWEQVRGVGGAYGVSAHVDMLERMCVFSSYRDPRIEGTLSDFRSILARVANDGIDADLVELSIISIIARELKPLFPKEASMIAFRRVLFGISDDFRANRRSWILETTPEDVRKAAKDLLDSLETHSSAVVIAGQELLEKEASVSQRLRIKSVKLPL